MRWIHPVTCWTPEGKVITDANLFCQFFRYLQEIGYTDTIIDVRSSRVRSLLGLNPVKSENEEGGNAAVNGTDNNSGTNKRVAADSQQKRGGKKVGPSFHSSFVI